MTSGELAETTAYSLVTGTAFTIIWYCMDDQIAAHFSNPALGTIPFHIIWWIAFMLNGLGYSSKVRREI